MFLYYFKIIVSKNCNCFFSAHPFVRLEILKISSENGMKFIVKSIFSPSRKSPHHRSNKLTKKKKYRQKSIFEDKMDIVKRLR